MSDGCVVSDWRSGSGAKQAALRFISASVVPDCAPNCQVVTTCSVPTHPVPTPAPTPTSVPAQSPVSTLVPTRAPIITSAPPSPPATDAPQTDDCNSCSKCVSIPGNSQAANDGHCSPCALGKQPWWPCNVDGLCKCAGSSGILTTPAPTPEPTPTP